MYTSGRLIRQYVNWNCDVIPVANVLLQKHYQENPVSIEAFIAASQAAGLRQAQLNLLQTSPVHRIKAGSYI